MSKKISKKEKVLREAAELLEKYTKEGDVVNISGKTKWYKLHIKLAYWGIRRAQRKLFKNPRVLKVGDYYLNPNDATHTMIKFKNSSVKSIIGSKSKVKKILKKNKHGKTFSVEPPTATLIDTKEFSLDNVRIYRYTGKKFDERDIKYLLKGTLPILGTEYDYGQLLNIAVNQVGGYAYDEKVTWFDMGSKRKVCSVGTAAVYAYHRHKLEDKGINLGRIFSRLNRNKWSKDFIDSFYKNGNRWNVESTYPANFGNAWTHFNKEFELVLWMIGGRVLYKK